jgi:diadenosine tetraphosphatase ApaH/serine/threonine PP2A family protein phosphatase
LPLTVCPELMTLRQRATFEARAAAWIEMLQLGVDVFARDAAGLDLNPANFATAPGDERLYYVDDEVYDALDARDIAGAIAARIPEEDQQPQAWARWGARLRERLRLRHTSWFELREELSRYPLPQRFESNRAALLDALSEQGGASRRRTCVALDGDLTCVFADVHGNAAALDAVIADAVAQGAERYLFLGDVIGYGPHPAQCVRRLAELPNLERIGGNHDHAIVTDHFELGMNRLARECASWTRAQLSAAELTWLAELPRELADDRWIAVHGAPRDPQRFLAYVYELTYEDNLRHLREQRIPVCFYGHTHVQLIHVDEPRGPSKLAGVRRLRLDPRWTSLVNPGSVGQPRDGDARAGYALWRRSTGELATLRVAYDLDCTVAAVRAAGLPAQLEHRLRTGT